MKTREDLLEDTEQPFNERLWIEWRLEIGEQFVEPVCSILFFLSLSLFLLLSAFSHPLFIEVERDRLQAKKSN